MISGQDYPLVSSGKIVEFLNKNKDKEYIEATIYSQGIIFRGEVTDVDVFTATDKVVDLVERQIRKNKTKLEKKTKNVEGCSCHKFLPLCHTNLATPSSKTFQKKQTQGGHKHE